MRRLACDIAKDLRDCLESQTACDKQRHLLMLVKELHEAATRMESRLKSRKEQVEEARADVEVLVNGLPKHLHDTAWLEGGCRSTVMERLFMLADVLNPGVSLVEEDQEQVDLFEGGS